MKQPIFEGSITNVQGIRVGQAENREAMTGVTVVLADGEGATVAADVRGAYADGSAETAKSLTADPFFFLLRNLCCRMSVPSIWPPAPDVYSSHTPFPAGSVFPL